MKWVMLTIGIIAILILLVIFIGVVVIYEIDKEESNDEW